MSPQLMSVRRQPPHTRGDRHACFPLRQIERGMGGRMPRLSGHRWPVLWALASCGSDTTGPPPGAIAKIVFLSNRRSLPSGAPSFGVYTMNADGSAVTFLTDDGVEDHPAWSPDHSRIVLTRVPRPAPAETPLPLAIMNADGSELTPITSPPAGAMHLYPDWGPGGRIAFTAAVPGSPDDIATVSPLGTGQVELTQGVWDLDQFPDWSSNSRQILFVRKSSSPGIPLPVQYGLYTVSADGSAETALFDTPLPVFDPSWSPDGRKIGFSMGQEDCTQVFVATATGTEQVQLTGLPGAADGCNSFGAWSLDGGRILFASTRDGNFEIYVMDADGSNPVNLTNDPAHDIQPDW